MHAQHVAGGDLRTGGRWTPMQRAKNDVIWAMAASALAATHRVPVAALRTIGRGLGLVAYVLVGRARRTALANVGLVFPDLDALARRALVRRSFATLGELLGETVALLGASGGPSPLALDAASRAVIEDARAEGRGVVFVSAHLGPWERVAASLVAAGVPLVTVARESYDPRFTRLYERLREARGVRVVWRGRPAAAIRMVRTLREGGVLGMPMDLNGRVPSSAVPFLGHPARTAIGPARIALRTGAAVVVGTAAPDGTQRDAGPSLTVTATRIRTEDLHVPRDREQANDRGALDAPARVLALTARINDELSRRILALPHAWPWMHPRWSHEQRYASGGRGAAKCDEISGRSPKE